MLGPSGRGSALADRVTPALALLTVIAALQATLIPAWRYGRSPGVLDAATGLMLAACALVVRGRARGATAALLAGAGLAWYLPAWVPTGSVAIDRVLVSLSLVHIGLLALAVLVATGWSALPLTVSLQSGAAVAAVLVAGSGALGGYQILLPLAGAMVIAATLSVAPLIRVSAVLLGGELLLGALLRLVASSAIEATVFRLHALAVMTVAVLLAMDSAQSPLRRTTLVGDPSVRLREELVRAAGVEAFDVLVRDDDGWVDLDGQPVDRSAGDTEVAAGWRILDSPAGIAVHPEDVSINAGSELAAVVDLVASQARLRAAVRRSVAELAQMQGRLVAAGDDERTALGERLRRGPLTRVARIGAELAGRAEDRELAAVARRTAAELGAIARGLDPLLPGESTAEALTRMASGAPVPVRVVTASSVDPLLGHPHEMALRRTAWFVCSEALSNAVKHAPGATVTITVGCPDPQPTAGERVVVAVTDDGPGGADPGGQGLVGLRDRAEAVSASLRIVSPLGGGTRLELVADGPPAGSSTVDAAPETVGGEQPAQSVTRSWRDEVMADG